MKKGYLVLSTGKYFLGRLHNAGFSAQGEVIFNTSMTGYQEILTDPSYTGQIVTLTYPQIGNYGINSTDNESTKVHASALIIKQLSPLVSNWQSSESLADWLHRFQVPILEGIDTRALVKILRSGEECQGIIAAVDESNPHQLDELLAQSKILPSMQGQNLAQVVSTKEKYVWTKPETAQFKVVAFDFGVKQNILRIMKHLGMEVTVVSYDTTVETIEEMNPDGVFLSNGPGDPEPVTTAIDTVKQLLGKYPIFGICLGHQILSLALGCSTYKLPCGHHGGNHPVMDYNTNKIEITSQNHGFAVDETTLPSSIRVTHRNLNDQTIEGIESLQYSAYSVQYHPEAAPGPHDSQYLFQRFVEYMSS